MIGGNPMNWLCGLLGLCCPVAISRMSSALFESSTLAQLFIKPIVLPAGARLWFFPPLALCIAVVYRATRSRSPRDLPKSTIFTFLNIVLGMAFIAGGMYAIYIFQVGWE